MDALTRLYADAWSQLPVELLSLVVVPAQRSDQGDDHDAEVPAPG